MFENSNVCRLFENVRLVSLVGAHLCLSDATKSHVVVDVVPFKQLLKTMTTYLQMYFRFAISCKSVSCGQLDTAHNVTDNNA